MTQSVCRAVTRKRRPMIHDAEVELLTRTHGTPVRHTLSMQADEYIRSYRWREDTDRRAEVVFAIEDPQGQLWLHAKSHYPSHIFRLPSGGVHWDESIEEALLREVREETNLNVQIEKFVGLLEYRFHHGGKMARFASYIFHLRSSGGCPMADEDESISEFRAVLPLQLAQTAADLRNLIGDRRGWGQWRAAAHDLVYQHLTG